MTTNKCPFKCVNVKDGICTLDEVDIVMRYNGFQTDYDIKESGRINAPDYTIECKQFREQARFWDDYYNSRKHLIGE